MKVYIDRLERMTHHGDQHVQQYDNRRHVIGDEHSPTWHFCEIVILGHVCIFGFCDAKQRPE